jgi:hypothetical protein
MFLIEDEIHAEHQGQFASFDEAMVELRRRAEVPWDQLPNVAPCTNWKNCGREYVVIEYDDSHVPWKEIRRVLVVDLSASGVKWAAGFDAMAANAERRGRSE